MKTSKNNIIDTWLEEHGDPEIERFVEKNLALTEKVSAILKDRGIQNNEFAEMLGKRPSEVSKWLSGLHNLTLKSIVKMETALGVDLINIHPEKEIQYVYLGSVSGKGFKEAITEFEETEFEMVNAS